MRDKNTSFITKETMVNLRFKDEISNFGYSIAHFIYTLLGANPFSTNHWILKTTLTIEELPSLWLAIGIDLLQAEEIKGLYEFPAIKTQFGLRIGKDFILDLVAKDANWYEVENLKATKIAPAVLLAGLPGSGKSTIAHELRQLVAVPDGQTFTTRAKRSKDIDFERGQFAELNISKVSDLRRSPIYAIPVIFRGKEYFFNAASLIERFNPENDLTIYIDSHYFRVIWRKRLMPDIRIVWLEASDAVLKTRLEQRLTQENVSAKYFEACTRTKSIADFTIQTDTLSEKEAAQELLTWLEIYN